MTRNPWLDDVQKNLSDLIARSPAADLQRNARAMLQETFSRLDLVTREEFDVQVEMVGVLRERLAVLEQRMTALEQPPAAATVPPSELPPADLPE